MKPFVSTSLALASACAAVVAVDAARPRYGGMLRVETAGVVHRIDSAPAALDASERSLRGRILPLVFEGLTRVDPERGLQPRLAVSWDGDADFRHWRIRLASGIRLHDGSRLQPGQVAASLRAVESRWNIGADQDTVFIELPQPMPDLPWVLADSTHAIIVRTAEGRPIGTGPFRLEGLDGSQILLRAHEEYRAGRPFVDAVRVQMGQPPSAQIADLEARRADLVEVSATDTRRVTQRGMKVFETRPLELMAVVFEPHRTTAEFDPLRWTVAEAIDRSRIAGVLLQQHAEPAVALLPPWLSGYTMRARWIASSRSADNVLPAGQRQLVLRFDAADPLAQSVADRTAVDVRAQGIVVTLQPAPTGLAPRPDMRLLRIRLPVTTPDRSFADIVEALGPSAISGVVRPAPAAGVPIEAVYRMESQLLDRCVVVPVVHLPELYAAAAEVATWQSHGVLGSGEWAFDDLWLRTAKP